MEGETSSITEKLKDYFSYEGRLNRWPYFLRVVGFYVFIIISIFLSSFLSAILIMFTSIGGNESGLIISSIISIFVIAILLVLYLAGLLFMLMQSIKRLHDLDKSGWYLLIRLMGLIPFIGWIISLAFELYLFLAEGTAGPNRFGPDPLGREASKSNDTVQSINSEVIDVEYEEIYEDKED